MSLHILCLWLFYRDRIFFGNKNNFLPSFFPQGRVKQYATERQEEKRGQRITVTVPNSAQGTDIAILSSFEIHIRVSYVRTCSILHPDFTYSIFRQTYRHKQCVRQRCGSGSALKFGRLDPNRKFFPNFWSSEPRIRIRMIKYRYWIFSLENWKLLF